MTKSEKKFKKISSGSKDIRFSELKGLLAGLGYEEIKTGKTSGSRVAFYNGEINDLIKMHKPHPSSIIKQCYLDEIIRHLKNKGFMA
ncbi:MAG: type II toxin-antitoxin system HicA family toxin [Deltaproteobacteria bacterium]|nr:type II toxin-antitoxin system HicA family toxin [Deltaproteobacteria bacterium]